MTIRIKDVEVDCEVDCEVDWETDLEVSETIVEMRPDRENTRTIINNKPPIYVAVIYSYSLDKEFVASSVDKKEAKEKAACDYNDATGSRSRPEDTTCYR